MREDQYDYIIEKPELNEETLAHYGVKGMKWRKHLRKLSNKLPGASKRRMQRYNAQKMADDVMTGRRKSNSGKTRATDIWNNEYSDKENKKHGRQVWTRTGWDTKYTTSGQFNKALNEARKRKNKKTNKDY